LYTLALVYVETGKAAILTAGGEPTAAMLFGIIFFSEVPTILSFIGLVITIIALSIICAPDKNGGLL
jgi:drug/metabolite transporter (DMT)-like permease